jgi:hypothetical protein
LTSGEPAQTVKIVHLTPTCSATRRGVQVKNVKRAWQRAVLVAHGFQPEYATKVIRDDATNEARTVHTALPTKDSQERLRSINLRFHDLPKGGGQSVLDAGVPLHRIQKWLGHTRHLPDLHVPDGRLGRR